MNEDLNVVVELGLSQLSRDAWRNLFVTSASDTRWRKLIWWHNKYYEVNYPNDGFEIQKPKKGSPEVPYKRALFYPSPTSRFSLGDEISVAYFSNDLAVNFCETIEPFYENPNLTLEVLVEYGGGNPTPEWYGYPLNFHLTSDAVVLDLSSDRALFFDSVNPKNAFGIWSVISSRAYDSKRITQKIANAAAIAGFDGIAYRSVRAPVDTVMPETNLVMFNRSAIQPGYIPK